MAETKEFGANRVTSIFQVMGDIILNATNEEIESDMFEDEDSLQLVRDGRKAVESAIEKCLSIKEKGTRDNMSQELHKSLGILLQLLRRNKRISIEMLANEARIEISEITKIECDPCFTPSPRTIYQLESYFQLPPKSLLKLTSAYQNVPDEFRDEVIRFAAKSDSIHKLTKEEHKLLKSFVSFLSKSAVAK